MATNGSASPFFPVSRGEITTFNTPDESGSPDVNSFMVATYDSAGAPADREFHVAVFC
jgi:hypothetical protein